MLVQGFVPGPCVTDFKGVTGKEMQLQLTKLKVQGTTDKHHSKSPELKTVHTFLEMITSFTFISSRDLYKGSGRQKDASINSVCQKRKLLRIKKTFGGVGYLTRDLGLKDITLWLMREKREAVAGLPESGQKGPAEHWTALGIWSPTAPQPQASLAQPAPCGKST